MEIPVAFGIIIPAAAVLIGVIAVVMRKKKKAKDNIKDPSAGLNEPQRNTNDKGEMPCRVCGTALSDGETFCRVCGTKSERQKDK